MALTVERALRINKGAPHRTSLLFLLTLCVFNVLGAQDLTVLRDARQPYILGPHFELFVDHGHRLNIDDIVSDSISKQFRPARSHVPNFSSTSAAIWVRFSVVDSTDEYGVWLLEVGYAMLDEVVLYSRTQDSSFTQMVSSSSIPVEERVIRHRLHYFHLDLRKNIPQQFFLRITARTSIPVALTIRHVREFMDFDHNTQIALGVFYGALLIMVIYNLFLYISIRDRAYLYYVLYVSSYTFYQLGMDGISKEYVITVGKDFFYVTYAAIGAFLFFGVLFTREYLATKQRAKLFDHILRLIGGLALIAFLFSPVLAGGPLNLAGALLGIGYIVTGFAAAIVCRRRGFRPATYYLIALSGFFVGFLLRIVRVEGLVPMNFFTQNSFQIGILWEVTMLSLALGNRINTLKAEYARERELTRHRIASDLHDEIGSSLSSIAVSSQIMKRRRHLNKADREQLSDITTAARETAEAMRDIVWFMNPEHDTPRELSARMKETASTLLQGVEVHFDLDQKALEQVKELQARRNVYLIFKESLNNIICHAHATRVNLSLRKNGNTLRLCIEDNGIGFDLRGVKEGNGLKNIRNRARQMQAELDIRSALKQGTQICLSYKIP